MRTWWIILGVSLVATVVRAEDETQRRAREEVERQLSELVGKAPSRVQIDFQPLEDPNLKVEELTILLDNKPVKVPSAAQLAGWIQDGPMPVATLDVSPERHLVTARITVHNTASPLVVDDGDVRWRVSGDVRFDVAPGLEVRVVVTPIRDSKQADPSKRLRLAFPSKPVMIAKLEDGAIPDAPKPVLVVADAGVPRLAVVDAVAVRKQAEEEARRAAAEERKRKAEEALEAKRAAAEERKRKADEALEAKRLAAEEKKRKADEALEARRLAAEEKKRKAEAGQLGANDEVASARAVERPLPAEPEPKAALPEPMPDASVVADAPSVDAGLPVDEAEPLVDAGAAAAVALIGPDAGMPGPSSLNEPESETPWGLIGAGAAGLVALIVLLARRASRSPRIDDP